MKWAQELKSLVWVEALLSQVAASLLLMWLLCEQQPNVWWLFFKILTSSGRSAPHLLLDLGFPVGAWKRTLPYTVFSVGLLEHHQLATKFYEKNRRNFPDLLLIYHIKMLLGKSTVPLITLREDWPFDLVFSEDNSQLVAPTSQLNVTSQVFIVHFPRGTGAFILLDVE